MIQNVMPKAPLRAIQYTGNNADEIAAIWPGAFYAGEPVRGMGSAIINLYKDGGQPVERGTWIIEVWEDGGPAIFLMVSDEYFREHYTQWPQMVWIDEASEVTEEQIEALKNWNAPITPMEEV